jgi:hypothetical protein
MAEMSIAALPLPLPLPRLRQFIFHYHRGAARRGIFSFVYSYSNVSLT